MRGGWASLAAAALGSALTFVASGGAGAADSLWIVSVDETRRPDVVIEVVAPAHDAQMLITPDDFRIDGATVTDVHPVDATEIAVGLVIDDRASVDGDTLQAEQGTAVELLRNLRPGTAVAISTASGVREPPTDRRAGIAAIADLEVSDASDSSMSDAINAAAYDLAVSDSADRHLVVVSGAPSQLSDADLATLTRRLDEGGIRFYLVVAGSAPDASLADVAANSVQATTSTPGDGAIARIDEVTSYIADRYLVSVTLRQRGPHLVTLSLAGRVYAAVLDLDATTRPPTAEPATTPTTSTTSPPPSTSPPSTSPVTSSTVPETTGSSETTAPASDTTTASTTAESRTAPSSTAPTATTPARFVVQSGDGLDDGPGASRFVPLLVLAAALILVVVLVAAVRRYQAWSRGGEYWF